MNPDPRRTSEPTCIWSQAGVLAPRPCHREYECDGCELFRAVSGSANPPHLPPPDVAPTDPILDELVATYVEELTRGCVVHLDRPATRNHLWLAPDQGGGVRVGLDPQVLAILHPVDDVLLPGKGIQVRRGEPMGWIQRGPRMLPLVSPLSGDVAEVHTALPEELERGSRGSREPWLLLLRPCESLDDVPDLLRGEAMLGHQREKLGLVRSRLERALATGFEVGTVLADGGRPHPDMETVLGEKEYRRLLEDLFRQV